MSWSNIRGRRQVFAGQGGRSYPRTRATPRSYEGMFKQVATKDKVATKNSDNVVYTNRSSWSQLAGGDLRKIYSEKTGSQYEALLERQLIYPVAELLTG